MPEPAVGDTVFWRSFRCVIMAIDPDVGMDNKGVVHYETVTAVIQQPDWVGRDGTVGRTKPLYQCSSNVADLVWNENLEIWMMGEIAGTLPHYNKTGTLIDPPLPTCAECGEPTYRVKLCAACNSKAGKTLQPIRG